MTLMHADLLPYVHMVTSKHDNYFIVVHGVRAGNRAIQKLAANICENIVNIAATEEEILAKATSELRHQLNNARQAK